jgi:hypothetical protein
MNLRRVTVEADNDEFHDPWESIQKQLGMKVPSAIANVAGLA